MGVGRVGDSRHTGVRGIEQGKSVDALSTAMLILTAIALATTLGLTPLVRRAALAFGMVDQPDGHRKLHPTSVPMGGGLAVFAGMAAAVTASLTIPSLFPLGIADDTRFLIGLTVAATIVCAVGLYDDGVGLRGRQKLAGQIVAVLALTACGLVIERVQVFAWRVELGLLAVPFTVLWLLGAINALNLLDGVDGLATSVGIVVGLALAGMALLTGHIADAALALAVCGSLAGFLVYNFPPAKVFLGDAGSMLVGCILGALAIRSSLKGPATVALAAPTAIWAIPFFDVAMAIVRRKLTGRSIYSSDRAHLHHCLERRGIGSRGVLAAVAGLCAVTAAAALWSVYRQNELLALGSIAAVIATLVVTGVFGNSESRLLLSRGYALAQSLIPGSRRPDRVSAPRAVRLHGQARWDDLWKSLKQFAERFDLTSVELSIDHPATHETYHAHWKRRARSDDAPTWYAEIPLVVARRPYGRLTVSGIAADGSACLTVGELIEGLKPFETQLLDRLGVGPSDAAPATTIPPEPAHPVRPAASAWNAHPETADPALLSDSAVRPDRPPD